MPNNYNQIRIITSIKSLKRTRLGTRRYTFYSCYKYDQPFSGAYRLKVKKKNEVCPESASNEDEKKNENLSVKHIFRFNKKYKETGAAADH